MTRRITLILAAVVGLGAGQAAAMQPDTSAELRATGLIGEQWNGYLAVVGSAPAPLRARMNAINIQRRAHYTRLAGERRVQIEQVGATMACDIFRDGVLAGQYYRLPDGVWRQRQGDTPIQRPGYCG